MSGKSNLVNHRNSTLTQHRVCVLSFDMPGFVSNTGERAEYEKKKKKTACNMFNLCRDTDIKLINESVHHILFKALLK